MTDGNEPRLTRLFVEAMAKHLPPSAARLRLVDVGGRAGALLTQLRGDLDVRVIELGEPWTLEANSIDAVVALDPLLTDDFFAGALAALRPGGRLIMVDPDRAPSEPLVDTLEAAGYTRILVEPAIPEAPGVLMRGEKPHVTPDTLERVGQVASLDDSNADLDAYGGRYLYLLVRHQPNKPVWALRPGEAVTWEAITVACERGDPVLLAFSSLPRAVGFMQPAVLGGHVRDVNKVAKFRREVAQTWRQAVLLNTDLDSVVSCTFGTTAIDPTTAEAPDE